ncbi:MAG: cytochrome c oxidase subunit 3 [Chloroflexota bacterium]|nr:cytochrome c oxidase subunit 3 [Chloroflexota bacterium]
MLVRGGLPAEVPRAGNDTLEAGIAPAWWGMLLLIATEGTIFALLLSSYVYLGFASGTGWPPSEMKRPELTLPLIGTVLLLGSSLPITWAERSVRQGHIGQLRLGLAIALVMSAVFLGIQALEYSHKGFTPQTNAYASLFYIITAFHGLHVFVALLMNATLQLRAALGHFDATRYLAVSVVGLYWHFVGAVWIFILAFLYVGPYLIGRGG